MIQSALNATNEEWVTMVGKYILNMGAAEMATRLLIGIIDGTDKSPVMTADLPSRLGYIRKRFPRGNTTRHAWAMNIFDVAGRHVGFRNAIAHSGIVLTSNGGGQQTVAGILNLTPSEPNNLGQIISLAELRGRVDESAVVGRALLEMQADFRGRAKS